ncbi:IclR family transcriptional regulator C-terminal domain-containing protein [Streptomyces thinghirensis]|nr:IclR family transcriptional regulator C-terminal domain-containing protein [Streptomyces thinghirensis]
MNDLTPRTITHRAELLRRLDAAFHGPAVTDVEEYALGTACIAVPVRQGGHHRCARYLFARRPHRRSRKRGDDAGHDRGAGIPETLAHHLKSRSLRRSSRSPFYG